MKTHTHTCERCRATFERQKTGYRFCSRKCSNNSKVKIDFELVRRMSLLGAHLEEMGRQANIHPKTVRRAISSLGITREWMQMRYLKCRGAHG